MSDQRIGTEMKSKLISREKKKNTLDESFECDSLTMYLNKNIILVLAAPWSKSPSGRRSTSLSLSCYIAGSPMVKITVGQARRLCIIWLCREINPRHEAVAMPDCPSGPYPYLRQEA